MMQHWTTLFFLTAFTLCGSASGQVQADAEEVSSSATSAAETQIPASRTQHPRIRPNVILCMADNLGWGDVGFHGNTTIQTPHLDAMANEGIRFNRFYSAAPVCSPTRASCLTGRHPYRTGVFSANVGILRTEEITLAELLKPHGYATGHFGKWHLGTLTADQPDANRGGPKHPELLNPPTLHGFDTYFSTESKVPTWDPMRKPANFAEDESQNFGWRAIEAGQASVPYGTHYWTPEGKVLQPLEGDDSRIIMDQALSFIDSAVSRKQPFFAVIWFHAPHLPCVAGPQYAARYQHLDFPMQQYAGCISALDDQMGRLRDKLKVLGVEDDTMLCFTSDNGPENNTPGTAADLRGRKRSLYEGGVRVPGLIVWPSVIKHPMVTDTPVVTSDYLPTVMDAMGLALPDHSIDGCSILPLLRGETFQRPKPIAFASSGQYVWQGSDYKLYGNANSVQLYDIANDPDESEDIAASHQEVVQRYLKEHIQWYRSCRQSFQGQEYGTASLEKIKQKFPPLKKPQ